MTSENRYLALAVVSVMALCVLIFSVKMAPAHDHNRPELQPWFESLRSRNKVPCCDGTAAKTSS